MPEHPDAFTWSMRVLLTSLTVAAAAMLVYSSRRADLVPDFLTQQGGGFFERDGLCFTIAPIVEGDVCLFQIYFQNRYERPCQGLIVLKRGLSMIAAIPIDCDAAGFGVVRVPYGVHADYQGSVRTFEVSAAVRYSQGRGKLLRFRGGRGVGKAKVNSWAGAEAIMMVGMLGLGHIAVSRAASLKLALPKGVQETVPEDSPIMFETLWRLGDEMPEAIPADR